MYQQDTTQQAADPKKLFVGNLPFSMTEEQITELFAQYGEIASVKLIIDKMTGRSRGFAFVTFASEEDAQKALEALNGMEVEGRPLIVTIARPLSPDNNRDRGPRRFDNNRGGSNGGFRSNRGGGGGDYRRNSMRD